MNMLEIHVAQPLWLLLLVPAFLLVLIPLWRMRQPEKKRKVSAVLHCVIALLLVLTLAGLSITLPASADREDPAEDSAGDEQARLLVISTDSGAAQTLVSYAPEGVTAEIIAPEQASQDAPSLAEYERVILLNVSADSLPASFGFALSQYVTDGGTLLVSGGADTLSLGGMEGTIFESLLPVSLEYTVDNGDRVALMLVLDCSNSMTNQNSYNSRSGRNNRNRGWNSWGTGTSTDSAESLSMAKQGAIRSIEALSASDEVGIVSFNSTAILQAGLSPATDSQKAVLARVISSLTTERGTYYTDALRLAWQQLRSTDAAVRHVIFLSDGEPSDWGYDSVVQQMAQEGITVSTIALGYSSSVLATMAQEGGGRYYAVTGVSDLPDIMLSETEQVASDPLIEGDLAVYLPNGVPSGLPNIGGYIGTTLKDGAAIKLQAENGDPILVSWTLGGGEASVFTSDAAGVWTAAWRTDENGGLTLQSLLSPKSAKNVAEDGELLAFEQKGQEPDEPIDLLLPMALIALTLLLVDIAIRKLRWKDLRFANG